jgi:glutathione S-transferase
MIKSANSYNIGYKVTDDRIPAMEARTITQAMEDQGLRLMTIPGVPSPWSEAAKGILWVKELEFDRILEATGEENLLQQWTGQTSKPVLVWNRERPATGWAEILHLAERLNPEPALIPQSRSDRITLFGISHELAGEMGLGWCFRLLACSRAYEKQDSAFPQVVIDMMANKYGWSPEMGAIAKPRALEILHTVDDLLATQHSDNKQYLIGDSLTALDIYWATFCSLMTPLPHELCPMLDFIREAYQSDDAEINAALSQRLIDHQRFIYETHLQLPVIW